MAIDKRLRGLQRTDRNSVRSDIFLGLNANAVSSPVGAPYSAPPELEQFGGADCYKDAAPPALLF